MSCARAAVGAVPDNPCPGGYIMLPETGGQFCSPLCPPGWQVTTDEKSGISWCVQGMEEPVTPEEPAPAAATPPKKFPWWAYVGIAGGMLVFAAALSRI